MKINGGSGGAGRLMALAWACAGNLGLQWYRRPGPGGGDLRASRCAAAAFRYHHIGIWTTYQPGSRYGLFEVIEFGWLAVLSVILVATAVVLVRRGAA
ncbi:MAG TPA: hypothetical protein VF834_01640 [Streptosporangiaceae bacterium]